MLEKGKREEEDEALMKRGVSDEIVYDGDNNQEPGE